MEQECGTCGNLLLCKQIRTGWSKIIETNGKDCETWAPIDETIENNPDVLIAKKEEQKAKEQYEIVKTHLFKLDQILYKEWINALTHLVDTKIEIYREKTNE